MSLFSIDWNPLTEDPSKPTPSLNKSSVKSDPNKQQLDIYNDGNFAESLSFWGEDNVWRELEYLLNLTNGKVLDICCGVGGTIHKLKKYHELDIHGFDISSFLIERAIDSGLDPNKLKVANAIDTGYEDNFCDYSYSIGSLEHFIEDDIDAFLKETKRITGKASFHQIPVALDKDFNGWLELDQSYFNMPEKWWLAKFNKFFQDVKVVDSSWNDPISQGKWFICK